jgi:hypothetical protein
MIAADVRQGYKNAPQPHPDLAGEQRRPVFPHPYFALSHNFINPGIYFVENNS